jgi:manganese transport protein
LKKILGLTLGIMTALGGFVDLGQIVFTMQGGALFGYRLLWVIVVGTAAIIVYMEMCGRIAVVAKQPVFATVRDRLSNPLGLATLIASNLLNLITCAAELGGIGIILHLLTGWNEHICLVAAAGLLGMIVALLKFEWIERTFGLSGLLMLVFALCAWKLQPNWGEVARGFLPSVTVQNKHSFLLYAYFAVGIFSAMLMEYEVHFYSSGAIEEDWSVDDLGENVAVAGIGSSLGSILTCALVAVAAIIFRPRGIFPDAISTAPLPIASVYGRHAISLALLGCLACIAGAAVETALSGAYNICQFYNLAWGKNLKLKKAPVFTATWMAMLGVATVVAITGIKPLTLVDFSIVFGMVIMPFTYYPILSAAGDHTIMGKHANGKIYNAVGWVFFAMITVASIAAIPLMILTRGGKP